MKITHVLTSLVFYVQSTSLALCCSSDSTVSFSSPGVDVPCTLAMLGKIRKFLLTISSEMVDPRMTQVSTLPNICEFFIVVNRSYH